MKPYDLDPSVTPEEIEAAQADPAQPFPDVEEQDDEEIAARAFAIVAPARPKVALATAKRYTDESIFVGVGMCLRTVRTYFDVAALWPDANEAQAHSTPFHKVDDPDELPRGTVGYCRNSRHGHVWLNLGGGLCRTTDFRRRGMVDIARVDAVVEWAGGTDLGWGEVLNGVDVWPNPKKPKAPPKAWTWQRRVQFLRNEAVRQQRDGHGPRAKQLRDWADKIAARHR